MRLFSVRRWAIEPAAMAVIEVQFSTSSCSTCAFDPKQCRYAAYDSALNSAGAGVDRDPDSTSVSASLTGCHSSWRDERRDVSAPGIARPVADEAEIREETDRETMKPIAPDDVLLLGRPRLLHPRLTILSG